MVAFQGMWHVGVALPYPWQVGGRFTLAEAVVDPVDWGVTWMQCSPCCG